MLALVPCRLARTRPAVLVLVALAAALCLGWCRPAAADDVSGAGSAEQLAQEPQVRAPAREPAHVPTRYGAAVSFGQSYTPNADQRFVQGWGFIQWDYDAIWPHAAPEGLRFKAEASVGATANSSPRSLASAGIMAQYYLLGLAGKIAMPYVEGGVHGIYTDFKVRGQGLRFNFNPQLGIGADFGEDRSWFMALRLHHISNGGLDKDNTGINSLVLMTGLYF